jgi:membrane-associated protease RseP (regulator of RpoE activity)
MVSTLTWVLVGLAAYTLLAMALNATGRLPDYIKFSGPITTIHTQRGKQVLTRLAAPRRFWRAWGNLGLGVGLVVMAGSFLLVAFSAYQAVVNPQPSALNEPRNALAIPGVNDFLPLSVAPEIVLGLALGLIVHEGGHGLFCRVEGIDIKSMGLAMLAVVPIGAFVEPNEEQLLRSDRGVQTRMYAAGVTNNFALSFIALLLLFGPVAGSIAVVGGAPVGGALPGSAANESGIGSGDVITAVDGERVGDARELRAVLARNDDRSVSVAREDGETVTVERAPMVVGAVEGSPLGVGTTITAVNGSAVYTRQALDRAARNHTVAEIRTEEGANVTTALGAYGRVAEGSPLAEAGAPVGESILITSLGDERTHNASALGEALSETSGGDTVSIVGYVEGQRRSYDVTLASRDGVSGGVLTSQFRVGISGFSVNDFGIDSYPAATFLEFIGGNPEEATGVSDRSFVQRLFIVLALPVIGVAGGFGYNFAGFTGVATEFYTVEGPLAALGDPAVFLLANVLFWTGWINLVIGQFNLIPTFPLDGGHLLRATTESVVSRLPVPDRRSLTTAVTLAVTASMILGLVVMVFGPRFFA